MSHGRTLLPQEVKVNIRDRDLSVLPEALAFSQEGAVFENGRLTVPCQVCRGFAGTTGGVNVGRKTTG